MSPRLQRWRDSGRGFSWGGQLWCLLEVGGGHLVTHRVGRFWQPQPGQRDRLVGALLRSRAPLQLVNGAADPNSGGHMVARWLSLAPHTDVVSLPHIGHWPQLENHGATAKANLAFQRHAGERAGVGEAA